MTVADDRWRAFVRNHPEYASTARLDEIRAADYARLDAAGDAYLDYTGAGLYAASQIRDLGLGSIRIITNNPKKIIGLEGYGLSVTEQVPIVAVANPHNADYLATKRDRMGHILHHQGLAFDDEMIHDERRRGGGRGEPDD